MTTYEYDAVGNKTRRTLPNGQYSTYGYNSRHQLTEINHFRADQSLIGRYLYTLNETGLRTAVTETQADINQASQNHSRTLTYNYDSLNRLSLETAIDADNAFGGSYSRTYHYDSVGNRSQQVHIYTDTQGQAATITTDYSYDANDQLLAETIHSPTLTDTISYQYDKNGNLTQKTNQNGVLARYHYTTDNKLSLIEQGNLSIRYAYDSQGNRIQSITTDSSQTTPKTETVAYLVDNNFSYPEVIEEQDAQGKLITSNTFVPKGVGDLLSINRVNQGTYYASEDALGSLRQLTNTQGKVEAQQQTTAWGEVLPVSNVSQYTAYGYTGERQDTKTGLVYLRAREYAPNAGRFVQRDSWAGAPKKPITLNQYIYSNADGVNNRDPSGNISLGELTIAESEISNLSARSGLAFSQGLRGLGWEFSKQSGKLAESWVEKIITECLKPKNIFGQVSIPKGGKKTIDLIAKLEDSLLKIEVKNKIPDAGSPAIGRLKKQLSASTNNFLITHHAQLA